VTLAVYEDYACPHCANYNAEGFPELDEAYVSSGEIRYEHRDLPIPVADPGSFRAANAARAVQHGHGDEAFWTYAKTLFEQSGAIAGGGPELFATLAEEQGHDPATVREAAVDRTYRRTVERDRQRAIELGAESTPTFVLNGEIVASGFGSGTVGTVREALDRALSETG
jgi:protein-disulfide isomerase